jgi:hypothetical protein
MKELSVREVFSPYVATEVEDLGVFSQTIGEPEQYRIVTLPHVGRLANDLWLTQPALNISHVLKRCAGCFSLAVT